MTAHTVRSRHKACSEVVMHLQHEAEAYDDEAVTERMPCQSEIRALAPRPIPAPGVELGLEVEVVVGRLGTVRCRGTVAGYYLLSPTEVSVEVTINLVVNDDLVVATLSFRPATSSPHWVAISMEHPLAAEILVHVAELIFRNDKRLAAWLREVGG
jgi:hypothetical protein